MQWNYILKTFKFTIIYHIYHNIFLERPRSPWEVHAEPLRLRGAQVGNLCCSAKNEFWIVDALVDQVWSRCLNFVRGFVTTVSDIPDKCLVFTRLPHCQRTNINNPVAGYLPTNSSQNNLLLLLLSFLLLLLLLLVLLLLTLPIIKLANYTISSSVPVLITEFLIMCIWHPPL